MRFHHNTLQESYGNLGLKINRNEVIHFQSSCILFSDSIWVSCRKLNYQNYVIKNFRGENKLRLTQWRYHCKDNFGCSIMPKNCVEVGCTNQNLIHESKLSFIRFPNSQNGGKNGFKLWKELIQMAVNRTSWKLCVSMFRSIYWRCYYL